MKEIPVKPVFVGKSPEGYRVIFDKVKVEPSMISVFGPDKVLSEVDDLKTDRINLAEYTRSVKINVGIHSSVRALRLKEKIVEVFSNENRFNKLFPHIENGDHYFDKYNITQPIPFDFQNKYTLQIIHLKFLLLL